MELVPGVTLLRLGGHFPGSTVLHWAGTGDKGSGGIMLTGAVAGQLCCFGCSIAT